MECVVEDQEQAWRDNNRTDDKALEDHWTMKNNVQRNLRGTIPPRTLTLKMALHKDLQIHFATKDSIKKKSINLLRSTFKSDRTAPFSYKKAALLEKILDETELSDLVTKIKSPKFKIAADQKTKFVHRRSKATLSCYHKNLREPPVVLSDDDSLDSRHDLTEKLKNISIHSYHINGNPIIERQKTLCTDLLNQTLSLDIGASGQSQAHPQSSVINPQSLIE